MLRVVLASALFLAHIGAQEHVLWRDPGDVAKLDFAAGAGGAHGFPSAPFTFVREDTSGSHPKLFVTDSRGRSWQVKFGPEIHSEPFASRSAWAAGYFVEPMYFVGEGAIRSLKALRRTSKDLRADGTFSNARFQLRDKNMQYLPDRNWAWDYNPFAGTPQLKGLKIVAMLTSNWDNKDATDTKSEFNTGVFLKRNPDETSSYVYSFVDWGGSMGRWGTWPGATDWDCQGFTIETQDFIKGVRNGEVRFGYRGVHTRRFSAGIRPADVAWIMQFLGRITDRQIDACLRAAGASEKEASCFTAALRDRLTQLSRVARGAAVN